MLSAKAQYSLRDARGYFEEHLCVGDYYSQGQTVAGLWVGRGAEELGLSGVTRAQEFLRLCENLHPQTGERLTQRQMTTRREVGPDGKEHQCANRRVFYDFTISPPKSVSVAALVGNDTRIVNAHEQAISAALVQLESFAATRVRKDGLCTDRTTQKIVAAVFRHETSRALDPHLHSHCIVFNATHDPVENRWKALQNHDMLNAQKFVENVYYHELTRQLHQFGYQIENKPRGDFDIKGISPELIQKFSKRHQEIDEKTRQLLEAQPERAGENIAEIRDHIAHERRARKIKGIHLSSLQNAWDGQLTAQEKAALQTLPIGRESPAADSNEIAHRAVSWAEDHLFDRRSVVQEHELWRHALEHARGQNVSLADLQRFTRERDYIRDTKHPSKITTRETLGREAAMVGMAKEGIGACHPFCWNYQATNSQLDPEQRQAVERILRSIHFVTLFRGGAGTGKSFALREVKQGLEQAGRGVLVIAPQRQQVMDLERTGFQDAQTVSAFLARKSMAERTVVIVDEAGQIGGKQMLALLEFVHEQQGRVILSGDTRQHGAVDATDALRAMEKYADLLPIELTNIWRQNPELAKSLQERQQIQQYKEAVMEARDGKLKQSFERLDKQGFIEHCVSGTQHEKLTACYLTHVKAHHSTVVVSQSWNEIHQVNERIREGLKREHLLSESETLMTTFQPVDFTSAQKRDARSYDSNSLLVFNRDVRGFKKGDNAQLKAVTQTHLIVENETRVVSVSLKYLDRITVCQRKELPLACGDQLQLKANGRSEEGKQLANGELVTVKNTGADGRIELTDGRVMRANYRQFVHGYAVTSYASQGKTVDYVLFSDSAVRAATNDQQWYVTISRGRKGVHIFTTDKPQLKESIARSGQRELALDLVQTPGQFHRHRVWRTIHRYMLRFGRLAADYYCLIQRSRSYRAQQKLKHARSINPVLVHRPESRRHQNRNKL